MFIGSVTDPYNPQEETYGRTRALLEQLKGSGAKLSIATKSDLILRDLDLIKSFPNARVSWSINTLDENFREDMGYWIALDKEINAFANETGLDYVTNDDSRHKDFNAPPVIVNYFYHEQIKKRR